jgi:formylmethanofuran dehydrogenase subunit E
MKDIKKLKKDDFINIAKNDRDLNLEEVKKLKLNDLRKLFNFTHMNTETNTYCKAIEGVNCMECFNIMKNDEHSSINKNYCIGCL